MTTVLAIDQGTSGTKAVVVSGEGKVLALSEVAVRPTYLPGGGVEQDPQALLDSVIRSGRNAINSAKVDVDIVTLANQGETVLAWDPETGEPLSNMIVWQDRRAESICAELREEADDITQRTGLVLDPYFSAPKQAWIRRNITTEGVVTTSDSWLLHQLTGEFVTDASTASRSLVMDIDTAEWDPHLLDLFGMADEKLPAILSNDSLAGTTTAFGARAAVGGLIVDQQAALVAQNCLNVGEAKCTFGTGAFLLANTGRTAVRSTAGLSSSIGWQQGGQNSYCLDGQIYTAASAVRWLEQLTFIDSAADLDRVAAPNSDGVMCVPALAGLAAPWWRPDAKAALTGMTLSTGSEHLVRAVLEGIAAQVAEVARCMATDLGKPLQRLRVDGGLTQSKVLMQAVADLMQMPVDVYPSQHATPLGAAALARTAFDPGLALEDAIVGWTPTLTFEPQWSADQADEFSTQWRKVAENA
ncbi:FGGY family carbohydrate kinase [Arthrobacter burdickii]|uniref:ATP:glycerol 3-phosphotransferase n=1 Tax=Arthrobacter burdickii TaxID=3035920 RepID=A0ABT8JWG1_9MICC|nr:FGGY family carbohydrate kinase [Arthrobacter burdickii]MDN4609513.1 FGGY family carbohydrate kinase [Arthrobacter burdickii]